MRSRVKSIHVAVVGISPLQPGEGRFHCA